MNSRCDWCNTEYSLSSPEWWTPDVWLSADGELPLVALYLCLACHRPNLIEFHGTAPVGEGDDPVFRPIRWGPSPGYKALGVELYKNTIIRRYRDEAWASFHAGRIRAAMIVGRSALQVCCRRCLPREDWGNSAQEMTKLAERAGEGWRAVGLSVKDYGNEWAHPDPSVAAPMSSQEVQTALTRLDAVLAFTAAMERVRHLAPHNFQPPDND